MSVCSVLVVTAVTGVAESNGAEQVLKPNFGKGRVKIGGVQFAGVRGDKTNNIADRKSVV